MAQPDHLVSRFVGCLLGGMCGDALGACPEGEHMSKREIVAQFGAGGLRDFVPARHLGLWREPPRTGMYTDDTNCVLALATSLLRRGGLDARDAAKCYAEFWLLDPERGYPGEPPSSACPSQTPAHRLPVDTPSAKLVLLGAMQDCDIGLMGHFAFPGGSYANGGAMRISPVGLAFRNASDAQLLNAVRHAVMSSHVHAEAIDGAFVIAKAIALLLATTPQSFEPASFLDALLGASQTEGMKVRLRVLRSALGTPKWPGAVWAIDENVQDISDAMCAPDYCNSWFQIRAVVAVPCVLWAFLDKWAQPEEAVIGAVMLGGDADTIGSLAGALAGALHGTDWIPQRWTNQLENGAYGRDYAIRTAKALAALDLKEPLVQEPGVGMDADVAAKARALALSLQRDTTITLFRAQNRRERLVSGWEQQQ